MPLVGVVGHDNLGFMIAESAGDTLSLQLQLNARVASTGDLYRWNGLMSRLTRTANSNVVLSDLAGTAYDQYWSASNLAASDDDASSVNTRCVMCYVSNTCPHVTCSLFRV